MASENFSPSDSSHFDPTSKELAEGLLMPEARIAPKFFYDALGSILFDAIVQLPEYYPPRVESAIFDSRQQEILSRIGEGFILCDLGAGDCSKAQRWLKHGKPSLYCAIDISVDHVRHCLDRLRQSHTEIPMIALEIDFSRGIKHELSLPLGPRLFFYPGSSIGNFSTAEAMGLLGDIHRQLMGGWLLLGVDLVKPKDILERAYNDSLGVTAAFNLNCLRHVNRRLGSDFDVADFEHHAFFNEEKSRIEMHLRAKRSCTVSWPGGGRRFEAGETIHTENSHKYSLDGVQELMRQSGYKEIEVWTDADNYFAAVMAR